MNPVSEGDDKHQGNRKLCRGGDSEHIRPRNGIIEKNLKKEPRY